MQDFELPVSYKGESLLLKSSLHVLGYTHRFIVEVDGREVTFEPDEERNYRATLPATEISVNNNPDRELLQIISARLKEILK